MTFERKLQDEIYRLREKQWNLCQEWIQYFGEPENCKIYNQGYCPMRCDYSINRLKLKRADQLYVNENIQTLREKNNIVERRFKIKI